MIHSKKEINLKNFETRDIEKKLQGKSIVIFGAGNAGQELKQYLETIGYNILFYCDNNDRKWGKEVLGIQVIKPADLLTLDNITVCIASNWAIDIAKQLYKMGIKNIIDLTYYNKRWINLYDHSMITNNIDKLELAYSLLSDNASRQTFSSVVQFRLNLNPLDLRTAKYEQYFHPMAMPKKGDIIIDGGAYDGMTSISYVKKTSGECQVFAFEPDKQNYKLMKKNIAEESCGSIETVLAGIWDKESAGSVNRNTIQNSQHSVNSEHGKDVALITIDSFSQKKNIVPNIIKLDIEGSEMKALLGAQKTIEKFKPILIVCLYHKAEDLWEIPLYIDSLGCNYNFYIGHHTQNLIETVLYCK